MRFTVFFITALAIMTMACPPLMAAESNSWEFLEIMPDKSQLTKPMHLENLKGHQVLLAFWRSDCAPCLRELNILPAIAAAHPTLQIALISLQNETMTRKYVPANLPDNMHTLIAIGDASALLAAFGSTQPALPFGAFLRSDGNLCKYHHGIIGTDTVSEWVKSC